MIPVTYPSSVSTSKESQMVVFALSSVAGLQRWTDYIPVKFQSTGSDVPNSFNTNGYIACDFITSLTGKQAWVDYIPVFVDNAATTAWQVSDTGFIPFNTLAGGGTYVSLDLNFINATALDSRITFSRGTNATLTDSNGRIAWAPHNLLTNSEDFEAAAWTPVSGSVAANSAVAPDGNTTADTLNFSGAGSYLLQNVAITTGVVYTISCYIRTVSGTANIRLVTDGGVSTSADIPVTTSWQRVSFTATSSRTATVGHGLQGQSGGGATSFYIWGAQLNVANAPVNLLTYSEQFDNAAWSKVLLNTTGTPAWVNVATAPDNTTTAEKLIPNAVSGLPYTQQTYATTSGVVYSWSVYLKAAGYLWVFLDAFDGSNHRTWFNLSTGTVGTVEAGNTSTITDVGNGWYRCTVTRSAGSTSTAYAVAIVSGNNSVNISGNGTDGVFAWGAQLNTGGTVLPYVATTSSIYLPPAYNSTTPKNLLGFTQEPENAAWTKSNSYVQQNLLTWSQDFDNAAWVKTTDGGITVSANTIVAPDGTLTADKFIPNAVAGFHAAQQTYVFPNTAHSFGFYAKAGEYSAIQIFDGLTTDFVNFNLLTGQVGSSSGYTGAITSVGDGWYRCTGTKTFAAGSTAIRIGVVTSSTAVRGESFTGNGTDGVFIWGAQLVQGSTAGDYTQTTSAAAPTRYLNWDGTLTGRKLVENTATGFRFIQGSGLSLAASQTMSAYAKAGERSMIGFYRAANSSGVNFNLTTGLITNISGTPVSATSATIGGLTATITPAGGGWYRCSLTLSSTATATGAYYIAIDTSYQSNYTGDGTSGIYVSDFQLSNSASVDPYVYNPQAAAASAAYYGPRFDYDPVTLASRGLLIEEQRANLCLQSADFGTTWANTRSSEQVNIIVAPDGTLSGDKLVEDTSASLSHVINQDVTVSASTTYTGSVYFRAAERTWAYINLIHVGVSSYRSWFDLSAGTVGTSDTGNTATIISVGNGWYRATVSRATAVGQTSIRFEFGLATADGNISYTGDGTSGLFIWGAQLEAGSFATSYIPTVASQVTRNADSASMLGDNFYTWFNPNQGTLSGEGDAFALLAATSSNTFFSINDGTANNYQSIYTFGNNGYAATVTGGAVQANPGVTTLTLTANQAYKSVYAYQVNNFGYTVNGATVVTDTLGSVPPASQANLGSRVTASSLPLNGHIRRINYYNTRLPDSTLQALTT